MRSAAFIWTFGTLANLRYIIIDEDAPTFDNHLKFGAETELRIKVGQFPDYEYSSVHILLPIAKQP